MMNHCLLRCAVFVALLFFGFAHAADPSTTVDIRKVAAADHGSRLAPGWQNGAFMEIFVRAWRDSDGDGQGDLRGLTQSLDYLQELGIKGIWLMPVTRNADGDHGYAVTDFRSIDPAYGTLADFDKLLREAHKRGIGVIMDYVINHGSDKNPLFQSAVASPASPYRDWFVWKDPAPTGWDIWGKNPWYGSPTGTYYATFGADMPDFNLENPRVMDYHRDSLRFWLNRGLDGFRFDAVSHLIEKDAVEWRDQPGSYALVGNIKALMDSYSNRYAVCESTGKPQTWAPPYICGSAFAFDLNGDIVNAARGDPKAIRSVADYYKSAPITMAAFIANHDSFTGGRLWDQLQGDVAQYRLAAATYLLLPGTPYLYYGEELGMAEGVGPEGDTTAAKDARVRPPMSWTAELGKAGFTGGKPFRPLSKNVATHNVAAERKDPNSIFAFYKDMLRLRNTLPSIARGSYEAAFAEGQVMGYQRKLGKEHTAVLINYGLAAITAEVAGLPAGAKLVSAYPAGGGKADSDSAGIARIALEPQSVRVFTLRR
ncbi:MAG: alpha-amylase family glycosyl hydrolase [Proteobacteria bacterium]|nr:alpha-amylase family glycosyl hydrolase [Pseudomonadota bacterium]